MAKMPKFEEQFSRPVRLLYNPLMIGRQICFGAE